MEYSRDSIKDEDKGTRAEDMGNTATDGKSKIPDTKNEPGITVSEKEHQLFLQLLDFSQLKNAASCEEQEQWVLKIPQSKNNAGSGSIRCRKIDNQKGTVNYELTVKVKKDDNDVYESTVPTNEAMFTLMKFLAPSGMFKHRYFFPTDAGNVWEIDVVPDGKGGYYSWARAEVEVKDLNDPLPELPIKTNDVIYPDDLDKNHSPEENDKLRRELMDKIFIVKNKYSDDPKVKERLNKFNAENRDNENYVTETETTETDISDKDENGKVTETEKVTTKDITDDPEKAEQVVEKAEKIKNENESSDDESDETSDDDLDEDEEDEDKKILEKKLDDEIDSATESYSELRKLSKFVYSLENFETNNNAKVYYLTTLNNITNKLGIKSNSFGLEKYQKNALTKNYALESIGAVLKQTVDVLIKLVNKAIEGTKEYYRKFKNTIKSTANRSGDLLKILNNYNYETASDVSLKYNIKPFCFDGNYISVATSVKSQGDLSLNYFDRLDRFSLYDNIVNCIKIICSTNGLSQISEVAWNSLTTLNVFPEKGKSKGEETSWVICKDKSDPPTTVKKVRIIEGNQVWSIKTNFVKDIKNFSLVFSKEKLDVIDRAPDIIKTEDKQTYIDILNIILSDCSKADLLNEKLNSTLSKLNSDISKAMLALKYTYDNDGEEVEEEVLNPDNLISLVDKFLSFIVTEKNVVIGSWLETSNKAIDYVKDMMLYSDSIKSISK